VHFFQKSLVAAAGVMLAAVPVSAANAQPVARAQPLVVSQTVTDFYRGRNNYPLWLAANAGDAAQQLMALLSTSNIDGIDPVHYNIPALQQALEQARDGKRKHVEAADVLLSNAFVSYVQALRQDPGVGITYVDPSLRPTPPTPLAALLTAAAAPSLSD
jgi:murein L,D-transpeptidase YcbB/YkuD